MSEIERERAELEAKIAELEAEKAEYEAKIRGAFPSAADFVQDLMRLYKEKGALSPADIAKFRDEQTARAEATAAGLNWLRDLGMDAEQLAEIASKGPDAVLKAIDDAVLNEPDAS